MLAEGGPGRNGGNGGRASRAKVPFADAGNG